MLLTFVCCRISELTAGKTVLRFGVDALDGVGKSVYQWISKRKKSFKKQLNWKKKWQFIEMEHANRARIREGAKCTSLLETRSDDGFAHECDSHAVAADESVVTSSTPAHTRWEACQITDTVSGDRIRKIFGHRRWNTTMTSSNLCCWHLSVAWSQNWRLERPF